MLSDNTQSSSVSDATQIWASSHLAVDQLRLTTNLPWLQVYSTDGGRQLKVFHECQNSSLNGIARLAEEFPGLLPRIVASNTSLSTVIIQSLSRSKSARTNKSKQLEVLTRYAAMQAVMSQDKALHADFLPLDVDTLLDEFIKFLDPDRKIQNSDTSQGKDFLSRAKCADYRDTLIVRKSLLLEFLQRSKSLPTTVNHGNLTKSCLVPLPNRELIIDNWEQVRVGPAGLSMQAVFDGCSPVYQYCKDRLAKPEQEQEAVSHREKLLDTYISSLVARHYATADELWSSIPASAAAGSIQSLLWLGYFPSTAEPYRKAVAVKLQARLSDILDLCDQLVQEQPKLLPMYIQDYQANGRASRAERLLKSYYKLNPSDAHALKLLADSYRMLDKKTQAKACYKKIIKMASDVAPDARLVLAEMYLEKLELEKATSVLSAIPKSTDPLCRLNQLNERINCVKSCDEQAAIADRIPALEVSEQEYQNGRWYPEKLAKGVELFQKYGVLEIDKAFDVKFIESCNNSFIRSYAEYFTERTHQKALRIGDKRYQIGLTLEGRFNDPQLYANEFVLPLMKRLLGQDVMIGCTVCAASLPGANDQHWHKDHKSLFSSSSNDTPMVLPPFAITTMIPFVSLDETTGTTSVIKSSQHLSNQESELLPEQRPLVNQGSCFLMDMRLSHRGIGNHSDKVRPILNMVYQQSWFSDNKNYTKHSPLNVSKSEYEKIPKKFKSLFRWGEIKAPKVNI